ncbi:hypothetical protein [Alteromonas facilis]|uniref:hypothetical protein n=1 Tax=Alteromonas facilis TaxID=2048004 RepID=UPI000C287844|nr:hypothetical protein [Alteromonas facilis]
MGKQRLFKTLPAVAALATSLVLAPAAIAQKHIKQNLSQMVATSASIVSGKVTSVTDGFDDRNRPYTEITIHVGQDAKGKHSAGSEFTFRQFGLLKPRSMGNGKVYLGVSPEGFANWVEGEQVIAFMNPDFGGGLRSTVGLEQGKFSVSNDQVMNEVGNLGLFDGMDTSTLSDEERNVMTTPGPVDLGTFMGLVGKLAEVK